MIITGGNIITADGPTRADVHFEGSRITAITPPDPFAEDDTVVDAQGMWVLPGGVDVHTHFGMPLAGGISSLGWVGSKDLSDS